MFKSPSWVLYWTGLVIFLCYISSFLIWNRDNIAPVSISIINESNLVWSSPTLIYTHNSSMGGLTCNFISSLQKCGPYQQIFHVRFTFKLLFYMVSLFNLLQLHLMETIRYSVVFIHVCSAGIFLSSYILFNI